MSCTCCCVFLDPLMCMFCWGTVMLALQVPFGFPTRRLHRCRIGCSYEMWIVGLGTARGLLQFFLSFHLLLSGINKTLVNTRPDELNIVHSPPIFGRLCCSQNRMERCSGFERAHAVLPSVPHVITNTNRGQYKISTHGQHPL